VKIVEASVLGARETNEDRVGHWRTTEAALLAVADGLGGHVHGEVAAQIAVDILSASFGAEARDTLPDPASFLERACAAGHAAILRETRKQRFPESPRTVLVACVVQEGQVFWTHVGDCRFYLIRGRQVLARSRDHTVVQRLVDEGRLREEAVATHPYRNRLLNCLGGHQTPRIDPVVSARLLCDDIVLLCSDGLWGPLSQDELVDTLASLPLERAIPELVAAAEASAADDCDNISVVAMTWE
jgi:serine/threonine protein phosphatase PrpC